MALVALRCCPPTAFPNSDLEDALSSGLPLNERLRCVQLSYARAAAALAWMAEHPGPSSLEEGRAISRKLRGLRKYVEIELRERKELGHADLDLSSTAVAEVVELLLGTFEAAASVLPEGDAHYLIMETRRRTEGWRDQFLDRSS
jgi:hypothetical protein